MGKQRNKNNTIKTLLLCLILYFSLISCIRKNYSPEYLLIEHWMSLKYPKEFKFEITGKMNLSQQNQEIYRGAIIEKEKRIEGVFFVNTTKNTVKFYPINDVPFGGKP